MIEIHISTALALSALATLRAAFQLGRAWLLYQATQRRPSTSPRRPATRPGGLRLRHV